VGGNPVAVFTTSVDLSGIVADPGTGEAIGALLPALMEMAASQASTMGQEMPEMSEEDLQQLEAMMPMVLGMAQMFLADTSLSMTHQVGVDDNYFYGFGVRFDLTVDPSMMGMMTGEEADPDAEPITVVFDLSVDISDHNGTFEFTVPEGAEEFPIGAMMGMGF
jgi:hypothetical protein